MSKTRQLLAMISPKRYFAVAKNYPIWIRWFIYFTLALIYPIWIFADVFALLGFLTLYAIFWVLLAPVRLWMKYKNPEEYAAAKAKPA
jgi:hypothetical protein